MNESESVSTSRSMNSSTSRRGPNGSGLRFFLVGAWGLLLGTLGCAMVSPLLEVGVEPDSLRNPPVGRMVGTRGLHGGFAWRGIPYAAAPIGNRRFRAPVPIQRWAGTREAVAFGPSCPQYASSNGTDTEGPAGEVVGNEDCLYLNVYAPAEASKASLPVMFWIHGGGNTSGSASFYNASRLASEHQVVVITLNYRLGFLGWFRHRAFRSGANRLGASGNFGTLDQILALDWVQENVSAFGGDPNNVTIFGESAGGWNVLGLLASPVAKGKFHRAIAQSSLTWSFSPTRAENYVDDEEPGEKTSSGEALIRLMVADGRAVNRSDAKQTIESMDAKSLSRYLREKTLAELFAAYRLEGTEVEDGYTCPRLFEDGVVLPGIPLAHAFRSDSSFNRVPVMIGSNKDEEKLFLLYNREYVSRLFGVIPRLRDRRRYLRDAATITRIWRMMAVDEVAKDLARSMPGQVFVYRFDWDEEPSFFGVDLAEMIGAAHGFEIPFVFGHWNLGPDSSRLFNEANRSGREALSRAMRSYWSRFARTGQPGRGDLGRFPEWPPWTPDAARFAILDTRKGGGVRMTEGSETAEDIATSILADSSYESLERRCMALAALFEWAPLAFSVEDYARAGSGLCKEFSIEGMGGIF